MVCLLALIRNHKHSIHMYWMSWIPDSTSLNWGLMGKSLYIWCSLILVWQNPLSQWLLILLSISKFILQHQHFTSRGQLKIYMMITTFVGGKKKKESNTMPTVYVQQYPLPSSNNIFYPWRGKKKKVTRSHKQQLKENVLVSSIILQLFFWFFFF